MMLEMEEKSSVVVLLTLKSGSWIFPLELSFAAHL
jgi:hypothetical protein